MDINEINHIIDEEVEANNELLLEIESQIRGGTRIAATGTDSKWWTGKQKQATQDNFKESKSSKMNTVSNGFGKFNKSINSSKGFNMKQTLKCGKLPPAPSSFGSKTFNKDRSSKRIASANGKRSSSKNK